MCGDVGLVQYPNVRAYVDFALESAAAAPKERCRLMLTVEEQDAILVYSPDGGLEYRVDLEMSV
jgi:hypothetical protein